jgi:E3 ubiquitin-protein ligase SIAH1
MRPPIFQCLNGHSVCGECQQRVEKCPTCSGASIDTRNLLAEELAYKVIRVYPCKNTARGCNEKAPLEAMKKHESVCPHRMYHCLVGREGGCTWIGRRSAILPHTEQKHRKYISRSDLCQFKYEKFNVLQECKISRIFSFRGEIFLFSSKLDPHKKRLYDVVQYIGPKGNASKYAYEHRLVSPSGDKKLTFVNVVTSDTDQLKDIHELRKCFVMEYDTLEMFTQNDTAFEYTVKMCRQN